MTRVEYLKTQIRRCYRLAAEIFDPQAADALRGLAEAYQKEIEKLEVDDAARPRPS